MKLPFLDNNSSSWLWPSCQQQPRTLSFRNNQQDMFRTINSAYLDSPGESTDELGATNSSSHELGATTSGSHESAMVSFSYSVDEEAELKEPESIETMIEGLRSSERLFFEAKGETSSILEEKTRDDIGRGNQQGNDGRFVLLTMESRDPYTDFRKSMEEMVGANGIKDGKRLEELLYWYLKVNGKSNHGYILGAFLDLLVGLSDSDDSSSTSTINVVSASSSNSITSKTTMTISSSSSTGTRASSCFYSHPQDSPSSPLSFYTSSSSCSEEIILVDGNRGSCLSTLSEAKDKIKDVGCNDVLS